jgi:hypothetical protein
MSAAVNSGIPPDYLENGRWYHGFHKGAYMYPCDEVGRFSLAVIPAKIFMD